MVGATEKDERCTAYVHTNVPTPPALYLGTPVKKVILYLV